MFEKFDKFMLKIMNVILFFTFVMLLVLVSAQVYVSMFTTNSLTWSEELSTFIMIWMVLLASVVVFRNKGHIWVENVTDHIAGPTKNIVLALGNFASLLFFVLIIYGAFTLLPTVHSQLSPACKIPMSYIYFAVPLSFSFTCVYALRDIYTELTSMNKKTED